MAYFCPSCPQPRINLPDDWDKDPKRWLYHRSYVADGNFSLVHQAATTDVEDIWIKSGEGFITERTRYQEHLSTATERKDVWAFHMGIPPSSAITRLTREFSRQLVTNTGLFPIAAKSIKAAMLPGLDQLRVCDMEHFCPELK